VKDVRKVAVPEWGLKTGTRDRGHNLIEMIMSRFRLKGAINVSGKHVLELKAMAIKRLNLEMGSFRNDPFKRKSINAQKILMVLC
jgi:hypothetical protein